MKIENIPDISDIDLDIHEDVIKNLKLADKKVFDLLNAEYVDNLTLSEKKGFIKLAKHITGKSKLKDFNELEKFAITRLKVEIIDIIEHSQPITNGLEGEIYKLSIEGKAYVITKRRFDLCESSEAKLQKLAKDIGDESEFEVGIPDVFTNFNYRGSDIIVMEYIDGKTLYNLVWQAIVNQFLVKNVEAYLLRRDDRLISGLFEEFKNHFKNPTTNLIEFKNDTECEVGVIELLRILYNVGLINEDPGNYDRNEQTGQRTYVVLEKVYKKYYDKVGLFNEENKKDIVKNLRGFIYHLNSNGFYHRDLGGNPRNIMFTKEGDNYKPHIIDFGRAIKLEQGIDYGWTDSITGGVYCKDNDIVSIIGNIKSPQKEDIEEPIGDFDYIINKSNRVGLDISERFLKIWAKKIEIIKNNPKLFYDRLISKIGINGGEYIFIKKKRLDEYESKSTKQGQSLFFVAFCTMDKDELSVFREYLNDRLSQVKSKASYEYKLIDMFKGYIDIIE